MRILFLDDDVERHQRFHRQAIGHQLDHAWTAGQAINKLDKGEYDLVYLDHDLDATLNNQMVDDIEDGRFVVRWIVANADRFPNTHFVCHSMNTPAAQHMFASLYHAGLSAAIYPLAWKESPDKMIGDADAK
jgi:hypothetical protein